MQRFEKSAGCWSLALLVLLGWNYGVDAQEVGDTQKEEGEERVVYEKSGQLLHINREFTRSGPGGDPAIISVEWLDGERSREAIEGSVALGRAWPRYPWASAYVGLEKDQLDSEDERKDTLTAFSLVRLTPNVRMFPVLRNYTDYFQDKLFRLPGDGLDMQAGLAYEWDRADDSEGLEWIFEVQPWKTKVVKKGENRKIEDRPEISLEEWNGFNSFRNLTVANEEDVWDVDFSPKAALVYFENTEEGVRTDKNLDAAKRDLDDTFFRADLRTRILFQDQAQLVHRYSYWNGIDDGATDFDNHEFDLRFRNALLPRLFNLDSWVNVGFETGREDPFSRSRKLWRAGIGLQL